MCVFFGRFRNTRTKTVPSPTKHHTKRSSSTFGAPMLSASSSNNHSLFSFGHHGHPSDDDPDPVDQQDSSQYNFLPQVSFDDLQSSLESASGDFQLTQFPSPTGEGSILEAQGFGGTSTTSKMVDRPSTFRNGGHTTARAAIEQQQSQSQQPPHPTRSRTGSILRKGSLSNRQASISSTASTMSTASDPRGQATIRPRRQNQYPPVSNTNIAKPPRKSVGPSAFESPDYGNGPAVRRRPSLNSTADRSGADSTRSSMDATRDYPDTSRNMTASRAAKLKTISEPPTHRNGQSTADSASLTDQSRTSFLAPRSPRSSKTGSSTPGSNRRLSVMPSHPAHHASGLGARTISPTDTQRMKRRSFMPDAQNGSVVLEAPPPLSDRPSSRSPSMLPRKTSTPSSQTTTPDANRKSYSSGLSVGSATSYNTVRTSTGSLQARQPQNGGSRLPAPKSVNPLPPANQEDEEDVPPVPAIPKVYESPKDSPAELQFLDKVKSSLALDSSSLRSTASSGSLSGPAAHETPRMQRKASQRKVVQSAHQDPGKKTQPAAQPRRNLRNMNLPPLTVGPLSTPTVNKIAKLQLDQSQAGRRPSSPPARQITKTPTTPMTASRSTFFSKRMDHYRNRSNSSAHHARVESPVALDSSSTESIPGSVVKTSVSPFLSSSVPKETGFDQGFPKRSQTGGEVRDVQKSEDNTTKDSMLQQKPSGPRAQRQPSKSAPKPPTKPTEKSPVLQSSPEEPQTPSSMTSLRRKLSLSWKRSGSKNEKHIDHSNMKHDAMPPPRIPISATVGNSVATKTGSPSISSKPSASYLDSSRRRKTSGSSLQTTAASHERTRSDGIQGTKTQPSIGRPAKFNNSGDGAGNRPALSHSASVMQKFLRSKASMPTVPKDVWTAELDRDDLIAEEEMRKLGSRRKETELAAKTLDTLRKRASPKERVGPQDAIRIAMLNIFERGEIIDYNDIFFCGTQNAQKVVGDLKSDRPNFGYDDERGDYTIVIGDHLAYRYEIVDVLGKGSFGQVVRCIDHKTGVLVAVKIIRNKKRFHQQALVEVNILQKLREWVSSTAKRAQRRWVANRIFY